MAFYMLRGSALGGGESIFGGVNYVNGVVTSGVVKPQDVRQQFGGSVGGAAARDKLFYFYAFDQQLRNFPGDLFAGIAGFYALTATQTALLANRGVTPAKTNAALNLSGQPDGDGGAAAGPDGELRAVDWQASQRHRLSVQYNRARWSAPGGARSAPVVDRGVAQPGVELRQGGCGAGAVVVDRDSGLSNELRVQYGRDLQYETAQTPLAQEPDVGPGGYAAGGVDRAGWVVVRHAGGAGAEGVSG